MWFDFSGCPGFDTGQKSGPRPVGRIASHASSAERARASSATVRALPFLPRRTRTVPAARFTSACRSASASEIRRPLRQSKVSTARSRRPVGEVPQPTSSASISLRSRISTGYLTPFFIVRSQCRSGSAPGPAACGCVRTSMGCYLPSSRLGESTWFSPPDNEAELNFSGEVTFRSLVGEPPSPTRALDDAVFGLATRLRGHLSG